MHRQLTGLWKILTLCCYFDKCGMLGFRERETINVRCKYTLMYLQKKILKKKNGRLKRMLKKCTTFFSNNFLTFSYFIFYFI